MIAVHPKSSVSRVLLSDSSAANAGGLDAAAEALMADIAAFDLEAARARVQAIDSRHTGLRVSSCQFPDVVPEATIPQLCVNDPEPAQGRVPEPEKNSSCAGGGLLDQLKAEVAERQRQACDSSRLADAERDGFDRRLRAAFEYFHDLTTQLNYLKPEVARGYFFLDSNDAFRNLAWQEGFADFRTQAERDGGRIERVSLCYTLKGPGERTLERAGGGVERLRQVLFDLGLKFECQERRNRQRELEMATFTVADEVCVQVMWRADFENRVVVMESRNLERLGYAACSLPVEAMGPAMLDEFSRLMLGRENRFRTFLIR
ncbi:MAG TPA: hypothetical protein PKM60_13000 [Zoogloea sp.]|nr:hypothetical protein [Zoogloea sp.]HQE39742.1 hypothetical protein [Zoogloea sp.]